MMPHDAVSQTGYRFRRRNRSVRGTVAALCMLAIALTATNGCHILSRKKVPIAELEDGIVIPIENRDVVWEKMVDVLHAYQFEIARENRLDGVIETHYKVGASILEPWHRDSVGFDQRLESSLQSIRRKVVITITPVDGGQFVTIEAVKELEDLEGTAANSVGGATFHEYQPFDRDLAAVVGQTAPSGWIYRGRDAALEQSLLEQLSRDVSRRD